MGSRMIRDGLIDSDRYWSVSMEARQMYVHLLLLADDFGCVSLSATFIRRRCFNDMPSHERIAKLISELSDADLVRPYEFDRGCYGFIPRFKQRLQRNTLKHPKPPEWMLAGDEHALEMFNKINKERTNPTGKNGEAPGSTVPQQPEVKRREEKRREETPSLSGKPDVMSQVREVLQFLRNMTGRQYREAPPTVILIKARLKTTSVEDIKRMLAYKGNQWLDDPVMEKYLRPATLFGATKFEQYLAEALAHEQN